MRLNRVWILAALPAALAPLAVAGGQASICDGVAGNLVQNCGFELGNWNDWTLSGTDLTFDSVVGFSPYVNSGDYGLRIGPLGQTNILSQTVADQADASYTLSFYLLNSGGSPNSFAVSWGNTVLTSITNGSAMEYTEYSFPVVGSGSDTLSFEFRQDFTYWGIDDVEVTAGGSGNSSPEPGTLGLLAAGVASMLALARRRIG